MKEMKKRHSLLRQWQYWFHTRKAARDIGYGSGALCDFANSLSGAWPEGPTVLAACDEIYYWRFAKALLSSIERVGHLQSVHLHLYWPTTDVLADIDKSASEFRFVQLTWTVDPGEFGRSLPWPSVYMTSARFMAADLIMDRNANELFVIDVDAVVKRPIWPAIKTLELKDGGLFFRPDQKRLWRKILAGAVLYTSRPTGREFSNLVARSMAAILKTRPSYHIDQLILYYSTLVSNASLSELPKMLLNYEFAPDAVIWTAKGKTRKQDDRFLDAQQGML